MARPKLAVRTSLGRRPDDIAKPPDGMNQLRLFSLCDLGPKPADLRLHYFGFRIEVKPPNLFKKHGPRHNPSGISHQIFKQMKIAWLQIDDHTSTRDSTRDEIHLKVCNS